MENIPFINVLNQLWRDTPKVYNSSYIKRKKKSNIFEFLHTKSIQTTSETKNQHNWTCLGNCKR